MVSLIRMILLVVSDEVEEFECVLEEVVVEVVIDVQHEMQCDFLGVHHLLDAQQELIDVCVFELALHQSGGVEARQEVLGLVGALPGVLGHHAFGLVVDVVDGCADDLAVDELEGAEHGDGSEALVVDEVVVVLLGEVELGLADHAGVEVDHEVVVHHAGRVLALGLRLVGDADRQQLSLPCLPHVDHCALDPGHAVGLADGVADLVVGVASLGVVAEVEGLEFELFIVAGLEPDDEGVVVALADEVFEGPLVVPGLVDCVGLHLLLQRVGVVAEAEAVVGVPAVLAHAEQTRLGEGVDEGLVGLFEHELMRVVRDLVGLQVEHSDAVLPCFEDDGLAVAEHAKGIHVVLEGQFEEDLPRLVAVYQCVPALSGHAQEDEGLVEGGGEVQDLEVPFGQFHRVVALQQHQEYKKIIGTLSNYPPIAFRNECLNALGKDACVDGY